MRPIARLLVGLLAGALSLSSTILLPATPAAALAPVGETRNDGANPFEVARLTAEAVFPGGATDVVLARADLYPDALAASYLAGFESAPILLTGGDAVHPQAQLGIDNLGATTVHLLGGTAAIRQDVADVLEGQGLGVERFGGTDRYQTAAIVSSFPGKANVGSVAGKRTALIASGLNHPDALASGPIAYAEQLPLLLTDPGDLTPVTASTLDALDIDHVVLLGGTAAVSDDVRDQLLLTGRTVQRLAGTDRYGTAAQIADFSRDTLGWTIDELILATGLDFPDAEVAGPLGGVRKAPIVLVDDPLPSPSEAVCISNAPTVTHLTVQGDTSAVSAAAVNACRAAAETVAPPTSVAAWVWANDPAAADYTPSATYQYNSTGATNTISRAGVGRYKVRFTGLATAGGTMHVTSYSTTGHCNVATWNPSAGDLVADVWCFDDAGVLTDARFTAMFQKPVAGDGTLGYVWANDPAAADYTPSATYQHNSTGATNTIKRFGTGVYRVTLPGLAGVDGHVMVTAHGIFSNRRCIVGGWGPSAAGQEVEVRCVTPGGAPADSLFTMTFVRDGGLSPVANRWAYVWANEEANPAYDAAAAYQASSTGGTAAIVRPAVGNYLVTLPGQAGTNGSNVQVTAYGGGDRRCNVSSWGTQGADMRVLVSCVNNAGAAADSRFTMAFAAA